MRASINLNTINLDQLEKQSSQQSTSKQQQQRMLRPIWRSYKIDCFIDKKAKRKQTKVV